jgi:hypothetical protein
MGLVAVLLWSAVIGLPVLLFHLNSVGMDFGEHFHSAVLFVASQALVFYLAARPRRTTAKAVPAIPQISTPFATIGPQQVWDAELVPEKSSRSIFELASRPESFPTTVSEQLPSHRCTTKVIICNYLASSHARLVYLEPGGIQHTLAPGRELAVTATADGQYPTIRVVESDRATQVYLEGVGIKVSVTENSIRAAAPLPAETG